MLLQPVRLRAIAAAVGLVFLPTLGCSWLSVTKAPEGPIEAPFPIACTSDVTAPVVDTVLAGLLAVGGTAYVVAGSRSEGNLNDLANGPVVAVGIGVLVLAVPFGISAIHGYSTTADCRHLKEAQLSCASGVEEACRSLQERKP